MKLKIYTPMSDIAVFTIRDQNNKRLAQNVSPELAAWIRAKAAQEKELDGALIGLHDLLCDEDLDEEKLQEASEGLLPNICDTLMRTKVIFGQPLTEDVEIEI